MTQALTERYGDRICGFLSCYDRLVITGTLPTVCYAEGMTRYLNARGIRIFDYPDFAKTLRERVRETAAALAAEAGVEIEHIGKPHIRKEDIVARVLARRGETPGLVHVISAMEACDAYQALARQAEPQDLHLRPDQRQMPALLFLLHGRQARTGVSARADLGAFPPAILLQRPQLAGPPVGAPDCIGSTMDDNAFVRMDDWKKAQALADSFSLDQLHRASGSLCHAVLSGCWRFRAATTGA